MHKPAIDASGRTVDINSPDAPTFGDLIIPGLTRVNVKNKKDATRPGRSKSSPDVVMYDESVDLSKGKLQYSRVELFEEWKAGYLPSNDGFRDHEGDRIISNKVLPKQRTGKSNVEHRSEEIEGDDDVDGRGDGDKSNQHEDVKGEYEDEKEVEVEEVEVEEVEEEEVDNTTSVAVIEEDNFVLPSMAEMRGQTALYAQEINMAQPRLHQFSLMVLGHNARFMLWDQGGVAVSKLFNYRTNSYLMVKFLWRFARMTKAERGYDPNVRRLTPAEADLETLARTKLSEWNSRSKDDDKIYPVWHITVPAPPPQPSSDNPSRPSPPIEASISTQSSVFGPEPPPPMYEHGTEFLACYPVSERDHILGRGTRAYPAVSVKSKKIVFLKESWRDIGTEPEAEIIAMLNAKKVPFAPTLIAGGDTGFQTKVADTLPENWLTDSQYKDVLVSKRMQHRFTIKEVCKQLSTFKSLKQLLQVLYDAFRCECHFISSLSHTNEPWGMKVFAWLTNCARLSIETSVATIS